MIQFKLNGKKLNIPSSWEDLSFNQYLQIMQPNNDYLKVVSIVSGLDYEYLKKAEIIGLEAIIQALTFLNKPPVIPTSVPKIGKYKLPLDVKGQFNIQFKRLDQFEDMRKVMAKDSTLQGITESYPVYVAIYLQAIRDGEYSYSKAIAMVDEIKEMPALEVISAGSFFLIKQLSLLTGTPLKSLNTALKPKNSKLGSTSSKKSSGRMRPSRKSRKK